jgi:PAS domain S-box-containing protein
MSELFTGGGELGARMRALDWAQTPFGTPAAWPQSLRSAVSICLNSRFPIAIYWGPQLALLYNDAWSPIPGEKHPWALGRPGQEVWPEIWDEIGPLFETVQQTGEGIWQQDQLLPMRRHGYTEECYFNFTFSPIRGEQGAIAGIFNAVIETTYRVIEERRARLLRDLGGSIAGAKSAVEVCARAAALIDGDPADLPFCLFYLRDGQPPLLRLVAAAGATLPAQLCPATLAADDESAPWRAAAVLRSTDGLLLERLGEPYGVQIASGAWPEPVEQALAVPIAGLQTGEPVGLLIVGISPRRAIDEAYHIFVERVALQIATAIGNAEAYEAERRRAEALAEIDQAKTAFFSNVSHEFRTPLTLMLGPLEDVLAQAEHLPAADHERLELAHRNALRLLKLVNALLDFSRIEAGRMQATFAPTDLAALTAELASVFRSAVERAGLHLLVDCPPLAEPVYVDRELWEKIVLNLLSNAFKFTFAGEITVALRRQGPLVELRVTDTGTGIPAEDLPHLFERFHRVKGARGRTFEGSGIGLALVQELVRLHSGSVRVESELGRGTTFFVSIPTGTAHLPPERILPAQSAPTFEPRHEAFVEEALRWLPDPDSGLPILDVELTHDNPDQEEPSSLPPQAPKHRPSKIQNLKSKILLADDNADMRAYIARLLSERYEVVALSDGAAALEAAQTQPFDLVLSDVMMPRLDGFGLLAALRADVATGTLPVILLSARAGEAARIEGMQAGADDYLVKPFTARELLARVEANLKLQRLRSEATAALRESEEKYRALAELSDHMIWMLAPDGEITYLSQRWFDYTGLGLDETRQTGWRRVLHPDEHDAIMGAFAAYLAAGEPYTMELRLRGRDGGYRWHITRSTPLRDEQGELLKWLGVTFDIDERKRAEERLRVLQEVTASFAAAQTLAEVRRVILHDVVRALEADGAGLRCVQGQELVLDEYQRGAHTSDDVIRRVSRFPVQAQHPATEALRSGQACFFGRAEAMIERYPDLAPLIVQQHIQASAHLPLKRGQESFGVLSVQFSGPREWDAAERAFAIALSNRAAVAYERARLFDATQAGAARFRTLVESTAQIIWTARPDGDFAGRQESWERFTGQRPEQYAAGGGFEAVHPDDRATLLALWQQVLAAPAPFEAEYRLRRHDGVYRYMRVRGTPVWAQDATLIEWVGVAEDLTEQHRRALNHAFLDDISQDLTRLADDHEIMRVTSEKIAAYLGVWRCLFSEYDIARDRLAVTYDWSKASQMRLQGQVFPISAFVAPPVIALLAQGQQVVVGDTTTDPATAARAEQFAHFEVGALVATPYLGGGRLEAALTVYDREARAWRADELELLCELAERIWTRVERSRAEATLREREAQLAAFLEHSPGSLFIKDREGRYVLVNHAFLTVSGKTADEVIGKTDHELFSSELAELFSAEDREVRESGQTQRFEDTFVYDGQEYTFLSQKFPLPGGSIGSVGTDLTERKRAEAERERLYAQEREARAAAEEASRLKDEFLATVSHELRTPLTAFLGYAQLLQTRKRDEAYVARTVEKMLRSAKAQAQLIEDLLDIARIVSGKLRLNPAPIDLRGVVYAALDTMRPAAEAKALTVQVKLDPAAASIVGDANRLQQVAWNLLANAVKFTPAGGTIDVLLERQGREAHLIVSDSGQGIRPDFLPYVFDRFRQADGTTHRAYSGLGLGLAIVRHLVELHGGSVEAASAGEGQGASFCVRLPLARAALAPKIAERPADAAYLEEACPPELAGLRVLIVDDQPEILELLEEILALCGAELRVANNAPDALATLRAWQPDLLLSDIAMPGQDGYWLIRQVRALPPEQGGNLPAIALTAYVRLEDRLQVLAAGFQQYVPKPIDPHELRDIVARVAVST